MFFKKILLHMFLAMLCLNLSITNTFAASKGSMNGAEALELLQKNNALYVKSLKNSANTSLERRQDTAKNGQHPYAIVLACADSRVPPEHIFNAGIGELFVMRNAGNVLSSKVVGSMEYGVEHLGVKLIVVLGHTSCGAVGAALACVDCAPSTPTSLQKLVHDIHADIGAEKDARKAEIANVKASLKKLNADKTMQKLINEQKVILRGAIYNIDTGVVEFL